MTDSTADSTQDAPQVLSTTTAAAPSDPAAAHPTSFEPFSDTVPVAEAENAPAETVPTGYTPNIAALGAANGEPAVFSHELYELIGHLTGSWIDEGTLRGWFEAFGLQVRVRATRDVIFQVANTAIPAYLDGDPALNLLDFRSDLVATMRKGVGIS